MYKVLLVFDNYELLNEIKNLHIWGAASEFEITAVFRDGLSAYKEMKQNRYDLVITEIRITGMDGLQLLRQAKREGLCGHVVLCSEFADFDYARQGIILGAFDYLIKPIQEELFFPIFTRIKDELYGNTATEIYYAEEIITHFQNHNPDIYQYISEVLEKIYNRMPDFVTADKMVKQVYKSVVDTVYEQNEWMDLYLSQEDFYIPAGISEGNQESYKKFYRDNLYHLYDTYCELFPTVNNEQIENVLLYILNNPESDLKQSSIAAKMHMNSSFLSTVFAAHTEIRFANYLLNVRLKRAAFLLEKTAMKVNDIAKRLYYKDTGYFSRIFKKKYGVPPSEYKLSGDEGNNYQI